MPTIKQRLKLSPQSRSTPIPPPITTTRVFNDPIGSSIMQLNVEGLTHAESEVIAEIAKENAITIILLQETHARSDNEINISGFILIRASHNRHHGVATLVRNDTSAHLIESYDTERITVSIDDLTVVNFYKAPKSDFTPPPSYHHPVIYSGDFNGHHKNWGYKENNLQGEQLADWASNNDLMLLYDNKEPKTFLSAIWNSTTNPDLTFTSQDRNSNLPSVTHRVGKKFPRFQHRPSFIKHPALISPCISTPVSRWNFRKADWKKFTNATSKLSDHQL